MDCLPTLTPRMGCRGLFLTCGPPTPDTNTTRPTPHTWTPSPPRRPWTLLGICPAGTSPAWTRCCGWGRGRLRGWGCGRGRLPRPCSPTPRRHSRQAPFYHWQIPPWKEVPVDDHLPETLHEGKSNLEATEDVEDKIKTLDPRVQRPIKTHIEVFGRLPPPASCHKLVNMDLRLKEEFLGQKYARGPIQHLKLRWTT